MVAINGLVTKAIGEEGATTGLHIARFCSLCQLGV